VGEDRCLLLAQDAYYKDGSSLSAKEQAAINYDHPEAYDTSLLVQDLRDLKAGRPVPHLTYDHARYSRCVLPDALTPRPVVILEGIIRRFVRPDPRPPILARALNGIQAKVKVFTHLPPDKVRETLGLVRGISAIEASSRLDFELAEQEALYSMLQHALELGANAVVDARLTTGTYETNGSKWQVSRPVYTGTAVRI
jgi:hypothetical protein